MRTLTGLLSAHGMVALVAAGHPAMAQEQSSGTIYTASPAAADMQAVDPFDIEVDSGPSLDPDDWGGVHGFASDPFSDSTNQHSDEESVRERDQSALDEHAQLVMMGEVGRRGDDRREGPLDRLANRIQNRVQNRVRNRIDRYYDPTADTTSSFKDANRRARDAGRPR